LEFLFLYFKDAEDIIEINTEILNQCFWKWKDLQIDLMLFHPKLHCYWVNVLEVHHLWPKGQQIQEDQMWKLSIVKVPIVEQITWNSWASRTLSKAWFFTVQCWIVFRDCIIWCVFDGEAVGMFENIAIPYGMEIASWCV